MASNLPLASYGVPSAASSVGPHPIHREFTQTLTLSTTINDVYQIFKLPVNAKILNAGLYYSDAMDDGTGRASLLVTDGTTTKTLASAITLATASGACVDAWALCVSPAVTAFEALPATGWRNYVTLNPSSYLALKMTTAANAPTARTITFFIDYSMTLEPGEGT